MFRRCVRRISKNLPGNFTGFNGKGGQPFEQFDPSQMVGGAGFTPDVAKAVRNGIMSSMRPELVESMKSAMGKGMIEKMQQGGGPRMGMMAFGQGVNEKGKRVARGAKVEFDPSTGKMSKDFVEKQLDPDDPMLPKETVENYDTSEAIEVDVEAATEVEGEGNSENKTAESTSATFSTSSSASYSERDSLGRPRVAEAEIIEEITTMGEHNVEKK